MLEEREVLKERESPVRVVLTPKHLSGSRRRRGSRSKLCLLWEHSQTKQGTDCFFQLVLYALHMIGRGGFAERLRALAL